VVLEVVEVVVDPVFQLGGGLAVPGELASLGAGFDAFGEEAEEGLVRVGVFLDVTVVERLVIGMKLDGSREDSTDNPW
jgi:hypothetical protein